MQTFRVYVNWSGYSRGKSVYDVKANDIDEAREIWYEGFRISHTVVRDDTEAEIEEILVIPTL